MLVTFLYLCRLREKQAEKKGEPSRKDSIYIELYIISI